jgi:integrase
MSQPVRDTLLGLPRLADNPYVFIGKLPGKPIVNVSKAWGRIIDVAGLPGLRIHDLRHTVGSVGVTSGASLALLGGVLGHRSPQTTARYAHLSDDPVRATSESIAERIAASLDPTGHDTQLPAQEELK